MNLATLLAKATVKKENLVKKSVKWERTDAETSEELIDEFDVHVVTNLSFAAQDRILLGENRQMDTSQMARAISERIRFGEEGDEKMTVGQAAHLEPSLGWALVAIIGEVTKAQPDPKN